MSDLSAVEDGEVLDVDYEINEREHTTVSTVIDPVIIDLNEKSSSEASNHGSDSDSGGKRSPVRKFARNLTSEKRPVKKNYNIWSNIATEDSLTNSLQNFDVGETYDKTRDVESYDYRLSYSYKTSRGAASDGGDEARKSHNSSDDDDVETKETAPKLAFKRKRGWSGTLRDQSSRVLLDLTVTNDSSVDEIVADIANKLMEEKDAIIKNVVEIAGKEFAFAVYNKTKRIEKDGGMGKENDTKRRTPGGIFFFLVKFDEQLTNDQKKQIFDEDRMSIQRAKRNRRRNRIRKQVRKTNDKEMDSEKTNEENDGQGSDQLIDDVNIDLDDGRVLTSYDADDAISIDQDVIV